MTFYKTPLQSKLPVSYSSDLSSNNADLVKYIIETVVDKEKQKNLPVYQRCLDRILHNIDFTLYVLPLKEMIIIANTFLGIICDENQNVQLRKSVCKVLTELLLVHDSFRNNKILKLVDNFVIDYKPLLNILINSYMFKVDRKLQESSSLFMYDFYKDFVSLLRQTVNFYAPEAAAEIVELTKIGFSNLAVVDCFKAQSLLYLMFPCKCEDITPFIDNWMRIWKEIDHCSRWDACWMSILFNSIIYGKGGKVNWGNYSNDIFAKILESFSLPAGKGKNPKVVAFPDELKDIGYSNSARSYIAAYLLGFGEKDSNKISSSMKNFTLLLKTIETFFHPSNTGPWTNTLGEFLYTLCTTYANRYGIEKANKLHKIENGIPCITEQDLDCFTSTVLPLIFQLLYSKNMSVVNLASSSIVTISNIKPSSVGMLLIAQLNEALDPTNAIHVHKLPAVMSVLSSVIVDLLHPIPYVAPFLNQILTLSLPGIDANDTTKTLTVLRFYSTILRAIPLVSSKGLEFSASEVEKATSSLSITEKVLATQMYREAYEISTILEEWGLEVLQRILKLLPTQAKPNKKAKGAANQYDSASIHSCGLLISELFSQMSDDLQLKALDIIYQHLSTTNTPNAAKLSAKIVESAAKCQPLKTMTLFLQFAKKVLLLECSGNDGSVIVSKDVISDEATWALTLLKGSCQFNYAGLLANKVEINLILRGVCASSDKEIRKVGNKMLKQVLKALSYTYLTEKSGLKPSSWKGKFPYLHWGEKCAVEDLEESWHVPSKEEVLWIEELLSLFLTSSISLSQSYLLDIHSNEENKNNLLIHLSIIRACIRGASNCLTWSSKKDKDAMAYPQTTGFPITSMHGLRSRITSLVIDCVNSLTSNKDAVVQTKALKLVCKITKLTLGYFGYNSEKVRSAAAWNRYLYTANNVLSASHVQESIIKGEEYYPLPISNRSYLLSILDLTHAKHVLVVSENVIQGLLEHGEEEIRALLQNLLSSMIILSQHEYSAIVSRGLAMVSSLLTKADWLRKDLLATLIEKLKKEGLLYHEYCGLISVIEKKENLEAILRDASLTKSLVISLCSSFPIVQALPSDKQTLTSNRYHSLILSVLESWVNDAWKGGETENRTYTSLVNTLVMMGNDSNLHWHYAIYVSSFLLVSIRADAQVTNEVWMYFINLITSASSSIPIKHIALVCFSSKLLPLLDKDTYKSIKVSDEIKSTLFSNSFRVSFLNAIIKDHEFYKSSTSSNSWSASVREVINISYPVRAYYSTYIVSNSRAKRCSTHTRAWHIDALQLYLLICVQNNVEVRDVVIEMKNAFEFDSHSSDRRYYLSGAAEMLASLGRITVTSYNTSLSSPLVLNELIVVLDKILPSVALEHFSDILDSIRMICFGVSYSLLAPLINWATNIISNIPSDLSTATTTITTDSNSESLISNFSYPAKVLRILAMIYFELNASHPEDTAVSDEMRKLVPLLINIMGHRYQTCRKHVARLFLLILQNSVNRNDANFINTICLQMVTHAQDIDGGDDDDTVALLERRRESLLHLLSHSTKTDGTRWKHYVFHFAPILFKTQVSKDLELIKLSTSTCFKVQQSLRLRNVSLISLMIETISPSLVSTNWHSRIAVLVFIESFRAHHSLWLSVEQNVSLREACIKLLSDDQTEVARFSMSVLAGILSSAHESVIDSCYERFIKFSRIKLMTKKKDAVVGFTKEEEAIASNKLKKRFAGVLGVCAIVLSSPYEMKNNLVAPVVELSKHTNDTNPIGVNASDVMSSFKRTHSDRWNEEFRVKFTPEELEQVEGILGNNSLFLYLKSPP